jgi:hypothetical protein
VEEIAPGENGEAQMDNQEPQLGTVLAREIRRRNWSCEETLTELRRMADTMGVRGFALSPRQLDRWLAGQVQQPRGIACRVAERLFGYPIKQLLAAPIVVPAPRRFSPDQRLPTTDVTPLPRRAAEQSRLHAQAAAAAAVDPVSIEALHQQVRRLSRSYATTAPLALLAELVETRDSTYRLLATTRRPGDLSELYLIAGQICGLAATTSWDLGDPEAAEDFAAVAWTYAQLCDHPSLRPWVRGVQATISVWAHRPTEALQFTADGLRHARGAAAVRLHAVAARAWTQVPDSGNRATHALQLAAAARDNDACTDEMADGIGGEFGFSAARQALCAGAVHLGLRDGHLAARHSRDALQLYEATPPAQRRWAVQHGALIDLATARALQGDLDGAAVALSPALKLAPDRRTARLTGRLQTLRRTVADSTVRAIRQGRELAEAIDDWTASALVNAPIEASVPTGRATAVPGQPPSRALSPGQW